MRIHRRTFGIVLTTTLLLALMSPALAQTQSSKAPARPAATTNPSAGSSEEQLAATRKDLIDLLRMSPKMVSFIKRDPLLLGDQEYVARNNPKLAEFLQQHPEIMRNPEFYLFADLPNKEGGIRDVYVDESAWNPNKNSEKQDMFEGLIAFTVFVTILGVLLWLLRVLLENRRWSRVFKVQTDIYNKLLDKFSTNEEMLTYIRSESGKRFLDSATMPFGTGVQPPIPNPVARVLTPLQLGVVLAIVGIGLIYLRSSIPDAVTPLSVFGTLALMSGFGFILSAGLAFGLAKHLGMLPERGASPGNPLNQHSDVP